MTARCSMTIQPDRPWPRPIRMVSEYRPKARRQNTALRLSASEFGALWTLVKDNDALARTLGYNPVGSDSYFLCLGFRGQDIDRQRVSAFLRSNAIELVEENVLTQGLIERPRFAGGVLTVPPSFLFFAAFRRIVRTGAYIGRTS